VSPNTNDIYYGPTGTLGGNVAVGTVVTTTLGGSNNFIAGGNVYVARQHFGNASDTLTTPSYSWLGAPTTGLYRQASNVVAFTANGNDQLRIGPQSLGIGSTNSQVNVRGDLTLIQGGAIVPSTSASSADGVHGIIWPANPGGASGSAWIKWYQGGFSSLYTTLEIGTGSDTHDILYFNTSGKVGFGVAVPTYKIDVSGDINISGAYYVNGVALGGGSGTVTSVGLAAPALFTVTNSPVTSSGTLTLAYTSGQALPVANGGTGLTTAPTNGQIDIGSTGIGFVRTTLTAGTGVSITNGAGSITINATGSGGTVTSVSFTGGIISVATATSTPALTVAGTSGGVPYFNSASTWTSSGALTLYGVLYGGGAGGAPAATAAGAVGQVLIGNGVGSPPTWGTVPAAAGVSSAAAGTGVTITGTGTGPFTGAINISIGQAVGTANNVQFAALGVGAANAVSGTITATGEITAYSSDARLKDNVTLITDPLTKIMQLRGVMFDWNISKANSLGFEPQHAHDVGVIAQEVQAVLPEAVRPAPFDRTEDGTGSKSGENYLTVQYEKLTALLIEAVKELKAEVDELKARLDGQ